MAQPLLQALSALSMTRTHAWKLTVLELSRPLFAASAALQPPRRGCMLVGDGPGVSTPAPSATASARFCATPSKRFYSSAGAGSVGDAPTGSMTPDTAAAAGASAPAGYHPRDRNMVIVYTCAKCETRSAKSFSRHSYERGIVMVRCPGCSKLHLVADHLGWFGDNFKVEDLAKERGERVLRVSSEAVEAAAAAGGGDGSAGGKLSWQDVVGWSRVQGLLQAMGGGDEANAPPASDASSPAAAASPVASPKLSAGVGGGSGRSGQAADRDSAPAAAEATAAAAGGDGPAGVFEVSPEDVGRWQTVAARQKQQQEKQSAASEQQQQGTL